MHHVLLVLHHVLLVLLVWIASCLSIHIIVDGGILYSKILSLDSQFRKHLKLNVWIFASRATAFSTRPGQRNTRRAFLPSAERM